MEVSNVFKPTLVKIVLTLVLFVMLYILYNRFLDIIFQAAPSHITFPDPEMNSKKALEEHRQNELTRLIFNLILILLIPLSYIISSSLVAMIGKLKRRSKA